MVRRALAHKLIPPLGEEMSETEPTKIMGRTLWDVLREWPEFSASSNLWLIVRRLERLEQKWREQALIANRDAAFYGETLKTKLMEKCRVKTEDARELSAILGTEESGERP